MVRAVLQTNHHEAAAAEIARGRMCDGERKRYCDRRIDRVAAALHDVNSDTRRDFICGSDHSMFRAHRFTSSATAGTVQVEVSGLKGLSELTQRFISRVL